jgi:hypothetical protein
MKIRFRSLIAVVAGALIASAGVAAAALPGAASPTAGDRLAAHGITVPGPNAHAGTHPDTRGRSGDDAKADTDTDSDSSESNESSDEQGSAHTHGKGSVISALAHSTTAVGVLKGAAISTVASNGHSKAGQHGRAAERTSQHAGGKSKTHHGKALGKTKHDS